MSPQSGMITRFLGVQHYTDVWSKMRLFTDSRSNDSPDELWLVQHPPVFTFGQAGKPEHLLNPHDVEVVNSDRGGQVTYHGPGQVVAYPLLNLRRLNLGVRQLVTEIELAVVEYLASLEIVAAPKADAPGVYVEGKKIASLGLRVRRGYSFHGVSLNVDMDLTPFTWINPCGYAGLQMTQVADCIPASAPSVTDVELGLAHQLASQFGYSGLVVD